MILGPLATLAVLGACAANMGGPRDVALSTVALRAEPATAPATAAAALTEVRARVALVAAPADSAWFASVAAAAGLTLSGPTPGGEAGEPALALMAMEPLGDTVVDLTYEGGTITMVDALYDLDERHFLDLMAFRVDPDDPAQPLTTRLLRYIATDVPPSAAIALAITVPDGAKGDSIARFLSPGYFDALRCAGADAPAGAGARIRLFFGPEARMWCGDATEDRPAAGARVRAALTAGLR